MGVCLGRLALGAVLAIGVAVSGLPHTQGTGAQALDRSGYDSQVWTLGVYETDPTAYAALNPDGSAPATVRRLLRPTQLNIGQNQINVAG